MATIDYKQKIKNYMNSSEVDTLYKSMLNNLFPELKESEDEKIRKFLIQEVTETSDEIMSYRNMNKEDVLAWLEKQKDMEAKLIISDEGYNKAFQDGIEEVLTSPHKYGLEKQGEQKPYGQREECVDCQCNYAGECKGSCQMKRDEQKPAWSEEDEGLLYWTVNNLEEIKSRYGESYGKVGKCRNWVLSLKDRVQPQPKQEWSEEDKEIIDYLIDYLESELDSSYTDLDKETFTKEINLLKSLRPQSQWKPTCEQMEYLAKAITTLGDEGNCKTASILNDLRLELKKLREK